MSEGGAREHLVGQYAMALEITEVPIIFRLLIRGAKVRPAEAEPC